MVFGGLRFSTVSATGVGTGPAGHGQNHTCGLTTTGEAYCWGDNWHNNLGLNDTRAGQPQPRAVKGVPRFQQIVTGGDHSCGLTANGVAWCWGDNLRGQLGNGPRENYNSAVRVGGGHTFGRITGGWDHTCGVTNNGDAYCWGWNNEGQLGDGSTTTRARPRAVRPIES